MGRAARAESERKRYDGAVNAGLARGKKKGRRLEDSEEWKKTTYGY